MSRQRGVYCSDSAQRNSVKYVAKNVICRIVMCKWTLLRILPLKSIALVSKFIGHTIRLPFALHVFGSMGEHIQM